MPVRNEHAIKLCPIGFSVETESPFTLYRRKMNTIGFDHAQRKDLSKHIHSLARLSHQYESDMKLCRIQRLHKPVER